MNHCSKKLDVTIPDDKIFSLETLVGVQDNRTPS
jgi:hypothetical protein